MSEKQSIKKRDGMVESGRVSSSRMSIMWSKRHIYCSVSPTVKINSHQDIVLYEILYMTEQKLSTDILLRAARNKYVFSLNFYRKQVN